MDVHTYTNKQKDETNVWHFRDTKQPKKKIQQINKVKCKIELVKNDNRVKKIKNPFSS